MSMAPLPHPASRPHGDRLMNAGLSRPRRVPTAGSLARRRWTVRWTKRLLPVLAVALLSSLALWPELHRQTDQERIAFRRMGISDTGGARLVDARYRGVDEKNEPYTVTAAVATQAGPDRVNLQDPKGDVTAQDGTWFMVRSKTGVFMQHINQLDLSGDVVLYRQDGTTLASDTATLDLKAGVAASSHQTHAEGPFGQLDAQGFALVDKGAVVQFTGPARLVLNGGAH